MIENQVDYQTKYARAINAGLITVINARAQTAYRCVKCSRMSVPRVEYRLAAFQPVGLEDLGYRIATDAGWPYPREWLRLTCRECDFSWNAFTDDVA